MIPKKVNGKFLFYALDFLAPKIKLLAGTQAVPIISKSEFEKIKITLPETDIEQQKIVEILSDCDTAISLLKNQMILQEQEFLRLSRLNF